MTTMTALHLADPRETADLGAFLTRLLRYDKAAAVRLRTANGALALFARLPLGESGPLVIRTAALATPALIPEGSGDSEGSVVARHEIDYLRPLVYRPEPVTIETWLTRLGHASFTVAYEIKDADTVYVRATTIVVPYDLASARPRRLTTGERAFLADYLETAAVAA